MSSTSVRVVRRNAEFLPSSKITRISLDEAIEILLVLLLQP